MKLSKSEEQVMQHLWQLEEATMKELIEQYTEPKPAQTTIATLLKRITDKGYINYKTQGKARRYYPLVEKSVYFKNHMRQIIQNFFGDSAVQFASYFTKATNLSKEELEALRNQIDLEIDKKTRK